MTQEVVQIWGGRKVGIYRYCARNIHVYIYHIIVHFVNGRKQCSYYDNNNEMRQALMIVKLVCKYKVCYHYGVLIAVSVNLIVQDVMFFRVNEGID